MSLTRRAWREPAVVISAAAAVAIACLLAAWLAAGPDFETALGAGKGNLLPRSQGQSPFTLVFYSDPHTNHELHRKLCRRMLSFSPDMALMGGDCVFDGRSRRQWAGFLQASAGLRRSIPLLPVKGNHDRGGIFEMVFDTPSGCTYYDLEYGDALLIVLDTELPLGPDSEQCAWLERRLSSNRLEGPVLVAMHKPPISSGEYFVNTGRDELGHLPGLFASSRVDLVLSGHEHFYERLEQDGVVYVVADSGGGGTRAISAPHPAEKVYSRSSNFGVLQVGKSCVHACFFDEHMAPVDFMTIPAGPG